MNPHRARRIETIGDAILRLLVLAGLPVALWRLTGNPIPRHLPTRLDVQLWWNGVQAHPPQALDILPRLLVDALWIAWAWYAAWFALAALWTLLHLPGIALPRLLLRLTPRTAAHALTLGAVAAAPAVHAAPPAHSAPVHDLLPASLDGRLHLTANSPAAPHTHPLILPAHPPAAQDTRTHRVVEHDTLWDLADHYYGHGEQWRRIYAANAGHPQPDGQRLSDPDLILPGWNLTIPRPEAPTSTTSTHGVPGAALSPRTPNDASRSSAPRDAPAPRTPVPGHTVAPAPPPTASQRPDRAAPRTPHAVGWRIPDGGYIGVTLLAAIGASVALLRTRHRRHPDSPPPHVPDRVADLAAVHGAALAADTLGYDPQEHPGQQPPPLLAPPPARGTPILGTGADQRREVTYDAANPSGPLAYTGPGADDAARALIISALSATALANASRARAVLIDRHLADELLDAGQDTPIPGWLHLTDTPHAAVAQFHTAARRRSVPPPLEAEEADTPQDPDIMLVLRSDEALDETVARACALAPAAMTAILLDPGARPQSATTIMLDQDGVIWHVTGPRQADLENMTVHTLTRDVAADIYRVLRAARTPHPPSATRASANRQNIDSRPAPTHSPPPAPASQAPEASASRSAPTTITVIDTHDEAVTPEEPDAAPGSTPVTADPRAAIRTPLLLRLLGPIDVLGPEHEAAPSGEKLHMLLALLALRPQGYTAQQLADAGWPEITDEEQRRRAAYTTISRSRTPFHTAHGTDPREPGRYIIKHHGNFRLDADQITTDLALLDRLTREADHAADTAERRTLLTRAAALHRGPLAHGVSDQGRDWLTDARYDVQQRIVHIHLNLADLYPDDPDTTIAHLQAATNLTPDDEDITAHAIRTYRHLGYPDLARTAHQRLIAALDSLGEQPSPEILRLSEDPNGRTEPALLRE